MKKLWNSLKIVFAMFSKIPMPYCDWTPENMEYMMAFFPLVGAVEGILLWGCAWILARFDLASDQFFRIAVMTVLPLLYTGGIHLDGFLDVSDALSSWQEKERRLEILKDSHAGAFAVIRGLMYVILYAGAVSLLPWDAYLLVIPALTLNRALISYTIMSWKKAGSTGMVAQFSRTAAESVVLGSSFVFLVLALGGACYLSWKGALALAAGSFLPLCYYRHMAFQYFGGINGDLSGWYNQVSELVMLMLLGIVCMVTGGNLWN